MQTESINSSVSDPASNPEDASALARRTMVDRQIKTFDVTDAALLTRMLEVPRELFLPAELKPLAYSDSSLQLKPGASGQTARTLLPPLILARLIQGARVMLSDKALVVAAGGGYSTALLAGLAADVVALESDPALFAEARANLDAIGLKSVRLLLGPLAEGRAGRGSVRCHSGRWRSRRKSRSAAGAIEEWRTACDSSASARRDRQGRSL